MPRFSSWRPGISAPDSGPKLADEVPAELRSEHALLDTLAQRYGLRLTYFHYLPDGWSERLSRYGEFGRLEVLLVDPYDIALSKLFSAREKDRDDVRILATRLDKTVLTHRLRSAARSLIDEPSLRPNAESNWYILYGEPLPA